MQEFRYIITDTDGIHARPAGEFVKVAKEFESDVKIANDGKIVDGKRIFGIMGLAAKQGDEIIVTVDGSDEKDAMAKIINFIKNNL